MAGFTTSLALMGAGVLANKLLNRKPKEPAVANPAQPLASGPTPLAAPAPPIMNPADANMAGVAAGIKQRKRAAAGSLLTNPIAPKSNIGPTPGRAAQRTLLGGGY